MERSTWIGCMIMIAAGCGTPDPGSDDDTTSGGSTETGSSGDSGSSSTAVDTTAADTTADDTSTDGTTTGPLDCDALTGTLAWAEQTNAQSPTGIALDPLSDAGEFYVSYRIGTCLSYHDESGQEQWSVPGPACEHIAVDSVGDVLLAGEDTSVGLGQARITKRSPDGTEQWAYGHTTTALSSVAQDVAIDPDDNVLVVGKDVDVDDADWVLMLDPAGNQQWLTVLPGLAVDSERSRVGVDDTGYITAAHTVRDAMGNNLVQVVQLDPSGAQQWSLDLPGQEIRLEAMEVDDTGRALVGLYTFDFATTTATRSLVLVAPDGTIQWTRTSEDTAIEYTATIAFGPCDTVVVAGMGDPGPQTLGPERQIWISKLTMDGDPLWAHMIDGPYEGSGDLEDQIQAIAIDDRGRVTAAGTVTIGVIDDGKFPSYIRDRWLGRFDP